MNLTEPHCGTDLGLMRTKAVPKADGSYKITGQKIFISSGEHDMADNIIHLVLAKVVGGPEGIKGVTLFIVPADNQRESSSQFADQRFNGSIYQSASATIIMLGENNTQLQPLQNQIKDNLIWQI